MSESIIANVVGPLLVLVVGWFLNKRIGKVAEHTTQTLDQVKNSHDTNFRDDVDALHQEVRESREDSRSIHAELREMRTDITGLRRDDAVARSDLDSLRRRVRDNEERMHDHLRKSEGEK